MTAALCAPEDRPPGAENAAPVLARIFKTLCEYPYGLTIHEMVDKVYGDDPDGGPDIATNSLNIIICRFNARAAKKKLGVRIWCRKGDGSIGHGRRWSIFIVREPR